MAGRVVAFMFLGIIGSANAAGSIATSFSDPAESTAPSAPTQTIAVVDSTLISAPGTGTGQQLATTPGPPLPAATGLSIHPANTLPASASASASTTLTVEEQHALETANEAKYNLIALFQTQTNCTGSTCETAANLDVKTPNEHCRKIEALSNCLKKDQCSQNKPTLPEALDAAFKTFYPKCSGSIFHVSLILLTLTFIAKALT